MNETHQRCRSKTRPFKRRRAKLFATATNCGTYLKYVDLILACHFELVRVRVMIVLHSRDVLEEGSPSRQHGIDARQEASYRWSYCEFLKSAGIELKM